MICAFSGEGFCHFPNYLPVLGSEGFGIHCEEQFPGFGAFSGMVTCVHWFCVLGDDMLWKLHYGSFMGHVMLSILSKITLFYKSEDVCFGKRKWH